MELVCCKGRSDHGVHSVPGVNLAPSVTQRKQTVKLVCCKGRTDHRAHTVWGKSCSISYPEETDSEAGVL